MVLMGAVNMASGGCNIHISYSIIRKVGQNSILINSSYTDDSFIIEITRIYVTDVVILSVVSSCGNEYPSYVCESLYRASKEV